MHSPTNETSESTDETRLAQRLAKLSPAQRALLQQRLAQRSPGESPVAPAPAPAATRCSQDDSSIAIVGMGLRLPGANNPAQYWELIQRGEIAVAPIPPDRWQRERFYDPTGRSPGKMAVDAMGAIEQVDQFDPAFFGIAPREASRMDPQQRLLLEVTWETLEQAGIPSESLSGSNTGVFIGIGGNDYSKVPASYPNYFENVDAHIGTGNALSIAAGRISYLFDLRGPSFIVDTACSSALVAIHNAVVLLQRGECDAALAGGVNLILTPETTIAFSKARMLSPDGQCRPFDNAANGYVRGEGCGIVLLKRLGDALAGGNQILGIIRGSAINQDGRTSGITAPSGAAQVQVIQSAMAKAGVDCDEVTYVEAHGTGTPLGDPIEMMALSEVFAGRSPVLPPIQIGSVKANIGHTETVSGIAGLLKVLQMFARHRIPGQANFRQLNTNARLNSRVIRVADSSSDWAPSPSGRWIAGISSFGFGGTNAHLIVESPPTRSSTMTTSSSSPPRSLPAMFALPLSAQDSAALAALATQYVARLDRVDRNTVHDICGSAATMRSGLPQRTVVIGDSASELRSSLAAIIAGDTAAVIQGRKPPGRRTRLAMLFTGQGSQYVSMGCRLAETLPAFDRGLQRAAEILDPTLPIPLRQLLAGDTTDVSLDHTSLAQPAICAIQCALVDTFTELDILPDVVAGHSIGEIAALYAAGALSRQDALRIAALRGQAMGQLPAGGAMAAVFVDPATVTQWIQQSGSAAVIAAYNGPQNTVIAGDDADVTMVLDLAQQNEIAFRRLAVSHAFHSPAMQPAADPLRQQLQSFLRPAALSSQITFISSLTGRRHQGPIDVDYWVQHLMQPVRFSEVMDQLQSHKIDLAIEIGPTPQLCSLLKHAVARSETSPMTAVPTLSPKQPAMTGWLQAVGHAWCVGVKVNWSALYRSFPFQQSELPTYPFQRSRYWFDPPSLGNHSVGGKIVHPLLGVAQSLSSGGTIYSAVIRDNDPNFLADHIVSGSVTVPAAAWVEALRAAAAEAFSDGYELQDIEIQRALFLEADHPVSLQTTVSVGGGVRCQLQIAARHDQPDAVWQVCATATAIWLHETPPTPVSLVGPGNDSEKLDRQQTYRTFATSKLHYGALFQVLDDVCYDSRRATASLQIDPSIASEAKLYGVHPTLLDGALQLIGAVVSAVDKAANKTFLPVGIKRMRVLSDAPIAQARVQRHQQDGHSDLNRLFADVQMLDQRGNVVVELDGVQLQSLSRDTAQQDRDPSNWLHGIRWSPLSHLDSDGVEAAAKVRLHRVMGQQWLPTDFQFEQSATSGSGTQWLWSLPANADTAAAATTELLQTIQSAIAADPAPHLSIITCGATEVSTGEMVNPIATAVLGMARVACVEHPQLQIRVLDLPNYDANHAEHVQRWLQQRNTAASNPPETELTLREGQFYTPRVERQRRLLSTSGEQAELPLLQRGAYRLRLDGTNRTEGLWVERIAMPEPKHGEVTVRMHAVGLNFSDVLKAMGLYPGVTDAVVPLGIEICGTVTRTGPGVDRFTPGQRVMGVVPYGFASDDVTHDHLLAEVPAGISDEEAAGIPIVFMTAHYALRHVASLSAGESVLIHAGAGGVGLAAIQVAHAVGATVLTTAGSPTKRTLLAQLGVAPDHIFDSRDLRSIDAIRQRTGGRGVDVVLNSLPGGWIDASLGLLAAHGRFLEIGKTDIYQNRPLGLAPFQDNLSYSAIDLDRMFRHRAAQVQALFAEVIEQFRTGQYQPLPLTSYRLEEVPRAMRFMAARRNIGKVVVVPPPRRPDVAEQNGVHLISGGSGAIAMAVAQRLIQRGAKAVALVARRKVSPEIKSLQQWARVKGAEIFYLQADCADQSALRAAIASLPAGSNQIISVIHAAGVLDDALIHELTGESLRRVLRPKVDGALALAAATKQQPLRSFQMLGSVAAVFGSPGQANYAAANAFLEGFAAQRRQQGLPANVIHWGPWGAAASTGSGGMADEAGRQRNLSARGLFPLLAERAVDLLIDALDETAPAVAVVVDADFGKMLAGAHRGNVPSLLRWLQSDTAETTDAAATSVDHALIRELHEIDADARSTRLTQYLADQLGKIMSLDPAHIDPTAPLGSLGLDSLMAIELKNTIEAKLDITLPISKFINDPTLETLATAAAEIIDQPAA